MNWYKKAAEFIDPFKGMTPDRKMNDRELTRAIRMSLSAEEEATHLYEAIADATDNEIVKKVMQDVANEEKIHVGEFQELLNKLLSDEKEFLDEGSKEVEKIEKK